ncbi:MAG TPA: hypothetical protein VIF62_00190 [Labilithrix sp.]
MPSRDWKESPPPGEAERFAEYARRFERLQDLRATSGVRMRALHAKSHGGFEASFEVLGDLPEHARHGLFAKPARYEALVRYSNGAGALRSDRAGDVRAMSIKVLGVDGKKVLGDARTQDFLAILSPTTPFRTADEFVSVVWAMRSPPLALFRIAAALGPLRALGIVRTLASGTGGAPSSLARQRFYSAAPIQCGPFAMRFRFRPDAPDEPAPLSDARDMFSDDLATRLRAGSLAYTMSLQFFASEDKTPIEDGSVDWPEDVAPYVDVAKLTIAKQDASSERGKTLRAAADRLSFDPWHALVEHRPLGGMMRARKEAYFASTRGRSAAPEPESLAALVAR